MYEKLNRLADVLTLVLLIILQFAILFIGVGIFIDTFDKTF